MPLRSHSLSSSFRISLPAHRCELLPATDRLCCLTVAAACLGQSLSSLSISPCCCPSLSVVSASVYPSLPGLSVCAVLPSCCLSHCLLCTCLRFPFLLQDGLSPPTHQHTCGQLCWSLSFSVLVFVLEGESVGLALPVGRLFSASLVCCVWVLDGGAGCRDMWYTDKAKQGSGAELSSEQKHPLYSHHA